LNHDQRTATCLRNAIQSAVYGLIVEYDLFSPDACESILSQRLAAAVAHLSVPILVKARALSAEDQHTNWSLRRCLLRFHLYLAPIL
jgi:hypothetical protein